MLKRDISIQCLICIGSMFPSMLQFLFQINASFSLTSSSNYSFGLFLFKHYTNYTLFYLDICYFSFVPFNLKTSKNFHGVSSDGFILLITDTEEFLCLSEGHTKGKVNVVQGFYHHGCTRSFFDFKGGIYCSR